jgi:cytoskeletal protein CcmA (bactofilin family)
MIVVDRGTLMRGDLVAAGKVMLDGWLEGQIICSRLEIGIDGYILGNVAAKELFVAGQIVGTVVAEAVHLMKGAFVEGDVHHLTLSVDPAATLIGSAVRGRGLQMPPVLLALEAKALANRANMDRAEQQASQGFGEGAAVAMSALV